MKLSLNRLISPFRKTACFSFVSVVMFAGSFCFAASGDDAPYTTGNLETVSASADYTAEGSPAPAPKGPPLGWSHQYNGLFNLSQTYFDNWAKGGSNALTWELKLEGVENYEAAKYTVENKGKAHYGRTQIANLSSRKSSDLLDLESIFTYKWGTLVNPFGSARLLTQFAAGYNYPDTGARARLSGPFDPTFITQTLGLGYTAITDLKVRLGGTVKETFSATRYGFADEASTTKIETFKLEPGLSFTTNYSVGILENILLTTLLDVFVNFKGVDEVDGRWENVLTAKVNTYINVNFGFDMLYDMDLSDSRQIKESLAVGISFLSI
jgi:hypothetical protein